jgi:putative flippase GtrA
MTRFSQVSWIGCAKGVKRLFDNQKIRFALIGGINTIIDFAIFNFLVYVGMSTIFANVISTGVALTLGYIANRKYTFNSKSPRYLKEVLLYFVFTLIGLWIIQNLVIQALLLVLPRHFPTYVSLNTAKALATLFSMVWNYTTCKHIVFAASKSD